MKKVFLLILATFAALLLVTSCSLNKGGYPQNDSMSGAQGYPDYNERFEGSEKNEYYDQTDLNDRKIIKTVNETLQTDDFDGLVKEINTLVASLGGYVSKASFGGESYYERENLRRASLTLKIPAEKLSEFTQGLDGKAIVSSYNETMNDVTGAYVDVESRISVLESEESALLDMLGKSQDVDTMLSIRTRLNDVQSDLASLRAQKKDYDSRIAYSTVYLNINEVRQAESMNPTFFEEVGYEFTNSLYGIGQFFRWLAVFILGNFLYIIIWGALIFAVAFLLVKSLKKTKKKQILASSDKSDTEAPDSVKEEKINASDSETRE